ncbi:ATP-binding cassette domain-containing protein [Microbacterium murale]|uniref:ABC-type glutathione transport system ATPase component n=1 Tax=Microbacterium murale TaxID=1081040 RepID=A0ABU0P6S9_9MICO|nr:ATP-binding cassette domain-containing protein [Microbacterium murale]MDQ0643041.1 ABC-type glutathione transport system ATPase component [Microbacterium murale]
MTAPSSDPILRVRDLRVHFGTRNPIEVVHGLDLDIAPGEVVAVVGESGSGKSVTALSVIGSAAGERARHGVGEAARPGAHRAETR